MIVPLKLAPSQHGIFENTLVKHTIIYKTTCMTTLMLGTVVANLLQLMLQLYSEKNNMFMVTAMAAQFESTEM